MRKPVKWAPLLLAILVPPRLFHSSSIVTYHIKLFMVKKYNWWQRVYPFVPLEGCYFIGFRNDYLFHFRTLFPSLKLFIYRVYWQMIIRCIMIMFSKYTYYNKGWSFRTFSIDLKKNGNEIQISKYLPSANQNEYVMTGTVWPMCRNNPLVTFSSWARTLFSRSCQEPVNGDVPVC